MGKILWRLTERGWRHPQLEKSALPSEEEQDDVLRIVWDDLNNAIINVLRASERVPGLINDSVHFVLKGIDHALTLENSLDILEEFKDDIKERRNRLKVVPSKSNKRPYKMCLPVMKPNLYLTGGTRTDRNNSVVNMHNRKKPKIPVITRRNKDNG